MRRSLQHIYVYGVFLFVFFSSSLLFSISAIIPTTKTVAFPRDSGKVPLAMHFFFWSVVTGEHE